MHRVIYPGSFDPATLGHLDVIERGRRIFDELIVGVGHHPGKDQLFSQRERVDMLRELTGELKSGKLGSERVEVRSFSGLTVDFARDLEATAILRGVRNLSDLQYEVQQAVTNREVAGLETVFIVAGQSFAYTSSSLIKQIAAMGEDLGALRSMVPALVIERLAVKKSEHNPILERLRSDQDQRDEG